MNKKVKRVIWIIVVLGIVIAFRLAGSVGGPSNTSQPAADTYPSTAGVATPPATPLPNPTSGPQPTRPPQTNKQVVDAAANITSVLSSAVLLPDDERAKAINSYVVPVQRELMLPMTRQNGQQLTDFWGYSSISAANASSQYSVSTMKFRIESLTASTATVSLYVTTHWLQADGKEYLVPGITIIDLQKIGGKWYFASASAPAEGQAPQPEEGLTFEQAVDRYQPFLKGYTDYV